MLTVFAVCTLIGFAAAAGVAAFVVHDHLVCRELGRPLREWQAHCDQALAVAAGADRDDWALWLAEWPQYEPRFRPWIEPEGDVR